MAYGNYGAWVFRDGVHMSNWEDQTPYREEDAIAGYWQAFGTSATVGADGNVAVIGDRSLSPHHAVLGGKDVRFCAYKTTPVLYLRLAEVEIGPYAVGDRSDFLNEDWQGEIDGYRFRAERFDGNTLDLLLIEPDGTRWTARSGYCYGAGWDETPVDAAAHLNWQDPEADAAERGA